MLAFILAKAKRSTPTFSEIEKSNDWIIAEQFMQGDEYTSETFRRQSAPIIKIRQE